MRRSSCTAKRCAIKTNRVWMKRKETPGGVRFKEPAKKWPACTRWRTAAAAAAATLRSVIYRQTEQQQQRQQHSVRVCIASRLIAERTPGPHVASLSYKYFLHPETKTTKWKSRTTKQQPSEIRTTDAKGSATAIYLLLYSMTTPTFLLCTQTEIGMYLHIYTYE